MGGREREGVRERERERKREMGGRSSCSKVRARPCGYTQGLGEGEMGEHG